MKIQLTKPYKSLQAFTSEELPDFTIIIGKNGSGKSQLVQKFSEFVKAKNQHVRDLSGIIINPKMNKIYTDTLEVENIKSVSPTEYRAVYNELYQKHINYLHTNEISKAWINIYNKKIPSELIKKFELNIFDDTQELKSLLSDNNSLFVTSDVEHLPIFSKPGEEKTLPLFQEYLKQLKDSLNTYDVSILVAEYHNKSLWELKENDFYTATIPEKYLEKADLIESKIETIFYNYLRKRKKNSIDYFEKKENGDDNSSISKDEFEKQYPDPIKQFNNILESADIPYFFKEIPDKEFSSETNVHFELIKKTSGSKIQIKDLSSGEKIIFGLINKVFISSIYTGDLKFPDIIILDEPDAHLHPQMCKTLIEVLNDAFVKKIGIKVIITTHSPTTLALAPDESIFQLNNEPETYLKKIAKDDALKILTSGLPNLSIDYKNHRQIFVESPTDLQYYQTIFNKLNADIPQIHQLYFISNALGKGNSTQVVNIVRDLREAGNSTSYGIIDWDKNNPGKDPINVHGKGRRYSIENYIFDPIYLCILLLEKDYGLVKNATGFTSMDNPYDLIKSDKAQKAIDYIIEVVEPRYNQTGMNKNLLAHKYGVYSYNMPIWFTELNGHKLKEYLTDHFDILAVMRKADEYGIEKKLINIIARVYPNVPGDTVELLKKLASQ